MDYSDVFNDHQFNKTHLLEYGFKMNDDCYRYKKYLKDDDFYVIITIKEKTIDARVYDESLNEEYIPFALKQANGAFVAAIKEEVQMIIDDIVMHCFEFDSMKEKILTYVQNKYHTVLECPFKDSPNIALKTNNNKKWYGLMMNIPYLSLGIEKEGKIDVLNIKNKPEKITDLIDHQRYFPAYHMNKKYWISVLIDNSLDEMMIYQLIDESYDLVEK